VQLHLVCVLIAPGSDCDVVCECLLSLDFLAQGQVYGLAEVKHGAVYVPHAPAQRRWFKKRGQRSCRICMKTRCGSVCRKQKALGLFGIGFEAVVTERFLLFRSTDSFLIHCATLAPGHGRILSIRDFAGKRLMG
jgi:hypothetical protein